jgi:hypothetical protein
VKLKWTRKSGGRVTRPASGVAFFKISVFFPLSFVADLWEYEALPVFSFSSDKG